MLSWLAGGDAGGQCLPIGPKASDAPPLVVGIELELQAESCSSGFLFGCQIEAVVYGETRTTP
jgi:hypothetical protein